MGEHRGRDTLEILATLLLAIAAVATAWSSYQATRWNGEQAKAASRANALRIDAVKNATLAQAETQVDVATFVQWIDAEAHGDTVLTDFYLERFRDEFRPAFDAWIATDPFVQAAAPPSPFAMPEYRVAAQIESQRLDHAAEAASAAVRRDIQRASNYVLGVVLFAVALFFAGISTKLEGHGSRVTMLTVGYMMFVGTAVWIATFPISLAV